MDTTTHIIIGLGLGALSQIDPIVAESTTLSYATLLGTLIGSNAPDFDYVYKFKGNSSYYRHHRGLSHSLLALPLWGLAVSGTIYSFLPDISYLHLFIWTFLSVTLHVFLDLFNVYGTQVIRPFSTKWISFDSIPLVDPYILVLHTIGFFLLPFYEPGRVFLVVYLLMFLYILIRTAYAYYTKRYLQGYFQNAIHIKLIPRARILYWGLLIETEDDFLFGEYSRKSLIIEHTLPKKQLDSEMILESMNNSLVTDFLSSTDYAYPFVEKKKNGTFVYWKDLRFRHNKFFPYLAVVFISAELKNTASYTGWVSSLKKYKKVIRKLEQTSASNSGKKKSYFRGVTID
ncbi:metal-dependent hydrolase [Bacillus cihuensis]|uniref:metal-dependent hydrolase n=1 Tax=Bacillus cihuensis TaxID=1208599 RepID=UPI00041D929F|nr:metal-dependent hydrolase [Bacillus cihuensis]